MRTEARNAPINIRARQTQRELIDRAAAAQHKSRSDFIFEAACKEAEKLCFPVRHRGKSDRAGAAGRQP